MNRKINSKILDMLSWPVFAVGQSPYRIDPEQPENIFYADPCFKIRLGHRGHSLGEQQYGPGIGQASVILIGKCADQAFENKHFPPFQFFHQRDLPQKETFKVMFVEKCQPGIRSKLIVIHT